MSNDSYLALADRATSHDSFGVPTLAPADHSTWPGSPAALVAVVRHDPLKGRGLFAARAIAEDEEIEAAPVAILDTTQVALLEETPLGHHYFHWDGQDDDWRGAVAFGLVSLVNHAEAANAGVWPDYERQCIVLAALRPIAEGEEITIHYDVDLWFDAH